MTAADLFYALELPMLASDPRVRVVADQESELDSCEVCVQRSLQADITAEVPAGKWRLTYHLRPGGPEWCTDLCGADCGDVELDEVLNLHNCVGVVLHLPAPTFLPGDKPEPAQTLPVPVTTAAVLAVLRSIRSTARQGEAWDAVETFRKAATDAVTQLGRTA